MKIKLWIIHKSGIGFSKIIAEMLRERLEVYIDVDVGNAEKNNPAELFEENFDYLIVGDVITKGSPSLEIQEWMHEYREISETNKIILKILSGYNITLASFLSKPIWAEFIQKKVKAELFYPPLLNLKLNRGGLVLEKGSYELIKQFSNDFINYILEK